jgi:hypothetical protein
VLEIIHRALLYKLKEYGLGGSQGAEVPHPASESEEEEQKTT